MGSRAIWVYTIAIVAANLFSAVIETPVGKIGIRLDEDVVVGIDYLNSRKANQRPETPIVSQVIRELRHYFVNSYSHFTVPFTMRGTSFQCKVWRALQDIKLGETLTYGQLAEQLGSGAQAVGNACRANPLPIVIPCHRVVAAHGLGGYAGKVKGPVLERKRWLLRHEGAM